MVKGRTSSNCTKSLQRCRLVAMKAAPFPAPSLYTSLYFSFSLFLSHSCLALPPSPWLSPTATTNTFWLTTHIFYWLEEAAPHGPSRGTIRSVGGGEDRSVGRLVVRVSCLRSWAVAVAVARPGQLTNNACIFHSIYSASTPGPKQL